MQFERNLSDRATPEYLASTINDVRFVPFDVYLHEVHRFDAQRRQEVVELDLRDMLTPSRITDGRSRRRCTGVHGRHDVENKDSGNITHRRPHDIHVGAAIQPEVGS